MYNRYLFPSAIINMVFTVYTVHCWPKKSVEQLESHILDKLVVSDCLVLLKNNLDFSGISKKTLESS